MSDRRRLQIAVLSGNVEIPYVRACLKGMAAAAQKLDVNLLLFPGMYDKEYLGNVMDAYDNGEIYQYCQIFSYASNLRPDAFIVFVDSMQHTIRPINLKKLMKRLEGMPCLVLESDVYGPASMRLDHETGFRACLDHLIDVHGYQRIAFIGGSEQSANSHCRRQIYESVLESHHLPVCPQFEEYGDFSFSSGKKAAQRLLERFDDLEAICCANDCMALGAYEAIEEKGLVVGRDIAVTGFDDTAESRRAEPPLSTVHTGLYEFGAAAVERVWAMLNGLEVVQPVLSSSFVCRDSCGCLAEQGILDTIQEKWWQEQTPEQWVELLYDALMQALAPHERKQELHACIVHFVYYILAVSMNSGMKFDMAVVEQILERVAEVEPRHDMVDRFLMIGQMFVNAFMLQQTVEVRGRLLLLSRRLLNYGLNPYHCGKGAGQLQLTWSNRFAVSMARSILQHGVREARLIRHVLCIAKKCCLGDLWLFVFDKPQSLGMELAAQACWNRLCLAGCLVDGQIRIFTRSTRPKASIAILSEESAKYLVHFSLFANRQQYGVMVADASAQTMPLLFSMSIQVSTALQAVFMDREQRHLVKLMREQNLHFRRQANSDELTGLYNRFGFFREVQDRIVFNQGRRALVAFADLDHLKEINDLFGHAEGDLALSEVATVLRQQFGEETLIGRIGGDEFVVLAFPPKGEDSDHVMMSVKRITDRRNTYSDKPYYVEISLGVQEFVCDTQVHFSELLRAADMRLYESKKKRRLSCLRQ